MKKLEAILPLIAFLFGAIGALAATKPPKQTVDVLIRVNVARNPVTCEKVGTCEVGGFVVCKDASENPLLGIESNGTCPNYLFGYDFESE